ncbi:hypothetical protein BIW53_10755 [Pseudoalteromonas byunsanensis]|uniref:MacB-like periplasmic core domain-containing protein n=2 Tax=Pseudoalteromonas byunsanensis TaxID=327939 RepID=A0A1S1NA87_9GAMM|nr:hypothetical protein BIW53_10755 [Pseudoalteromonas byunsanensis]
MKAETEISLAIKSFGFQWQKYMFIAAVMSLGIAVFLVVSNLYINLTSAFEQPHLHQLYKPVLNDWKKDEAFDELDSSKLPPLMSYQNSMALAQIEPGQNASSFKTEVIYYPSQAQSLSLLPLSTRVSSISFFEIFNLHFKFGGKDELTQKSGAWVVLSNQTNERLFAGANSVGKKLNLNGHYFEVAAVLEEKTHLFREHDVVNGAFEGSEDIYLPWQAADVLNPVIRGKKLCKDGKYASRYLDVKEGSCLWVNHWVKLADSELHAYEQEVSSYAQQLSATGMLTGETPYQIYRAKDWYEKSGVINNDSKIFPLLAIAFMFVCAVNACVILYAQAIEQKPDAANWYAFGLSRRSILSVFLIQSGICSLFIVALTFVFSLVGISVFKGIFPAYETSLYLGLDSFFIMVVISISFMLFFSLFPGISLSRVKPVVYLKQGGVA